MSACSITQSADDGAQVLEPITVLVVEDHEMVATAIERVIGADPRIEVCGVATTVADAGELARRHRPAVIVIDYQLRDEQTPASFPALRAAAGNSSILVLTGLASELAMLTSLDAGARGFLSKEQPLSDLVEAVVVVAQGDVVVAPHLVATLASRSVQSRVDHSQLSRRELEILDLLAGGADTATAAAALAISPNTLRNHLARASLRLGVHSRLEAVSEAIRRGIISPPGPH